MALGDRPVLITGGAGFIGTNLAAHLASLGGRVRIYDNLSRPGVDRNLAWLEAEYPDAIEVQIADVRDRSELRRAVADAAAVFHLAAQVAVTTSLADPRHDFDTNSRGTLELLEELRALPERPPLIYTSTNKVYGGLADIALRVDGRRWRPTDDLLAATGIDETRPLELCTPHGCSKGTADQYVLDYARCFRLPATVFRIGSIYGPHQLGTEDHGWVAHFFIRALEHRPLTIYGDGFQVRDLLFVDDLVDAFVRAWSRIDTIGGCAFNIGGGPHNTISLVELLDMIGRLHGTRPQVSFEPWRIGDQRYYVSDSAAFTRATGWRPRVSARSGIEALHGWLVNERARAPHGVIRA